MQRPEHIRKGDKVLILAPSSQIKEEIVLAAKSKLELWGLEVEISRHCLGGYAKFAGTPQERLEDFQEALDRDDISVIYCARGGYGAVHLLDRLDFTRFRQHPKWLIGFSDISALHLAFQKEGFMSVHSPMAKYFLEEDERGHEPGQRLHEILFGLGENPVSILTPSHSLNRIGEGQGTLRGGNLAVMYGLRGTPWDYPAEGTVLFIEDVGERPHAIERMVWNLRLGGVLEKLSGLIIGQFTDFKEDCSLGKELYEALADVINPIVKCPVCYNFPVGHVDFNLPLLEGAKVSLKVHEGQVELSYI